MMILSNHLPALQIVIPLIAAPLCALMPRAMPAWGVALLATLGACAVSVSLLFEVIHHGVQTYHMGNWPPPYGIEYRVDTLSATILVLVSGISAVMLPYALRSVGSEICEEKIPLFYSVYLLCLTGLLGIVITNDAFNIYVFLEISSLATYTLIAMGRDRRSMSAAFQYLILGTIGATFILIGIGLLYQMTGTLNITDLAQRISAYESLRPVRAAFAFLTVGLCLKIALFPLHMWLPNAYSYSPSFVSAFLAATATKVGVYALLRVLLTLFGADFSFADMPLAPILATLSLLAIVMGSMSAVFQHNIKTLLAFSSIAQMGYIALGISTANLTGLTAAITHIINHAVTKGALFLALGAICYRVGKASITEMRGIGQVMPLTAMAFVLAGLSLIGVPLTAGFISKWYLLNALAQNQAWLMIGVVLLGSLLAVIYVWRVVELMYFQAPPPVLESMRVKEAPLSMLIPLWVLVVLTWVLGVHTDFSVGLAAQAVAELMEEAG